VFEIVRVVVIAYNVVAMCHRPIVYALLCRLNSFDRDASLQDVIDRLLRQ
jgi:hypothetical protein